jgi:hypothetical protein
VMRRVPVIAPYHGGASRHGRTLPRIGRAGCEPQREVVAALPKINVAALMNSPPTP